jgi:(S)-mandelate dehydrogenase
MSLARAYSIADLNRLARRRLPRVLFDFLEGGAEDHVSLRANREALDALAFSPRTLVDVSGRSQRSSLLGKEFDSPFGIAPMGAAGLYWHEAEIALARAALGANLPFILSTHSFVPLERLVREAGAAPWYQLYLSRDWAAAEKALARALAAGCHALVLTTDVPVGGNREYNERNGFGIPFRLGARNLVDGLLHPRWLAGVFARMLFSPGLDLRLADWGTRHDSITWQHVCRLRALWPGKLLLKGILRSEDALLALEHGVDGIILSNHGGRQLDGAPPSIELLPEVAATVGGRLAIALDGGVRRGSDIVKALALGADFVFVGRAAMYGLAVGGEAGVRRAIDILKTEVDRVLALLGCPSARELSRDFLRLRGDPREETPREPPQAMPFHDGRAAPRPVPSAAAGRA